MARSRFRLPRLKYASKILPFGLVVLCTVAAVFLEETAVLPVFVATVVICAWRRCDPGMMVGAATLILVGYALLSVSGVGHYANKVVAWAYCFIVIGLIGLLSRDNGSAT